MRLRVEVSGMVTGSWWKGQTHLKTSVLKQTLVSQDKKKNLGLDMCMISRSLVAKVGLFFLVKPIRSQLQSDTKVSSLAKSSSWIGVVKKRVWRIKEGPPLKPSSSKLGTCRGQISLPWLTKLRFKTNVCSPHMRALNSKWRHNLLVSNLNLIMNSTQDNGWLHP